MLLGSAELIIIFTFLAMVMLPTAALVDMLKRPEDQFRVAGQSRILWALVVLALPMIGALLYFAIGRPPLKRATIARPLATV